MNEELGRQLSDIAEYTGGFLVSFVQFILGVALFVGIIWVASWIGGKARRWFMRRTKSRWVTNPNGAALVENLLRLGTFAAGLVLALGVVGASTDSLVTWIGVIVAALSLALQDIIKNLVAGFYLLVEQPFKTGDRLIIGEQDGYVESVALRVTGLRNTKRQLVLVPNYIVFSQVVTNRTALESHCLVINVSEIPGNPGDIEAILLATVRDSLGPQSKAPGIEYRSIKPTGTTIQARIWMARFELERDPVILRIHEAFPTATIEVLEG